MKHLAPVLIVLTGLAAQSMAGAADTGDSRSLPVTWKFAASSANLESRIQAEQADDKLNAVYSELRSRLPESEQATLRAEQREWLKQRDRLRKDSPEYAAFIESRVKILQNRLEDEADLDR